MAKKYSWEIEEDLYLLFLELREVHRKYLDLICSISPSLRSPNFENETQELDYLLFISLCDELMFLEEQVEKFGGVKLNE